MTVGGNDLVSAGMKPHFTRSSVNRSDSAAVMRLIPLEDLQEERGIRPGGFI